MVSLFSPDLLKQHWRLYFLFLLTLLAYWGSFSVPFYLDDYWSIVNNRAINEGFNLGALWEFAPRRLLTYISLSLNHHFSGQNTASYHVVNLLAHLLTVLGLYALCQVLTGAVREDGQGDWRVSLLAAGIFATHPLHTQGVTYIVQRAATFSAAGCLLALAAYVHARRSKQPLFYGVAAVFALLALFSKESAFVLPLALLVVELILFQPLARAWKLALAALVAMSLGLACLPFIPALDKLLRETTDITRLEYLLTQTRVLWIYVAKFFLFMPQQLEFDLPLQRTVDATTLLAIAGHAGLIGLAVYFSKRQPLIAVGILLYYVFHLMESSLLPIRDLAFEHRTYLPDAGLCLALAVVLMWGVDRWQVTPKAFSIGVLVLCAVLALLTWKRNAEWQDPEVFHARNGELAPNNWRVWYSLAEARLKRKDAQGALEAANKGVKALQNPAYGQVVIPVAMIIVYARVLLANGKVADALRLADDGLKSSGIVRGDELVQLHLIRADSLVLMSRPAEAKGHYELIVQISPRYGRVWVRLGALLEGQGDVAGARTAYTRALEIDPGHAVARQRLAALAGR